MGEPHTVPLTLTAAETGTQWWSTAVRAARARPRGAVDHSDLYDLAAELVTTLGSLEDLTVVLARASLAYCEREDLRDDEGADPQARLLTAATVATSAGEAIALAVTSANAFWSAIGHVGRHYDPGDDAAIDGGPQTERGALDQGADGDTNQEEGR